MNYLKSAAIILLYLIVLAMPYGARILPFCLSLFTLITIIKIFIKRSMISNLGFNYTFLLLPVLSVIGLITILYSVNVNAGLKILERHISFIIFPFFFLFFSRSIQLSLKKIVVLLAISLIILYGVSIVHYQLDYSLIDTYKRSKTIIHFIQLVRYKGFPIQHPSYLSYFILIFIVFSFKKLPIIQRKFYKATFVILIAFSVFFIFLLGSRAAILSIFGLLVYLTFKVFFQKRYLIFALIISISVLTGLSVLRFTRLGNTIIRLKKNEDNIKKADARLIIWQNAVKLIKQKPVFGYGIGDALDEMVKEHKRIKYKKGIAYRFDAHNQFLEVWLQSGIIGLISLLLVFAIPLYQSIKKRQELLFLFLMVSIIQLLFESMFIRLAGVVYFSFFYSYLYYYYYAPSGEWETEQSLKFREEKEL